MTGARQEDAPATSARLPGVLLADDEPLVVRALRRMLESDDYDVFEAGDAAALLVELDREPAVVLLDLRFGETSGEELLGEIRARSPDSEIIVMTGYATVDSAVKCMRAGVYDYLEKPFGDPHRVRLTLRSALERRALRVRNRELEGELGRRSALEGIAAQSRAMRQVVRTVRDLADNESNVLLEAESGTGKEVIARAIHETSARREAPFVPVDCGALPEGIIEAELFGHERGAFTGATRSAPGLFRSADGGTLFLDEIGELPLGMQSKLLRATQEREVRPLGAASPISIDVRIIAATNRNLGEEVRAGRFRSDLYYRLRVVSIEIPPLRERAEDIAMLASHFLARYGDGSRVSGIEPEAIEAMLTHPWHGNVRELENVIEAAVALAPGPRLRVEDLGLPDGGNSPMVPLPEGIPLSLEAYEGACIAEALRRSSGDVRRAAQLLGIGRSTLYRRLRKP